MTKKIPAQHIIDDSVKPTRLVQCIQCHNEEALIKHTMRSIYDEVDKIIVIEGATVARPNRTEDGHSTDATVERIQEFIEEEDKDNKVLFVQNTRPFIDLEEMKNTFLHHVEEDDWLIINDADEFYRPEDIRRIRDLTYIYPDAREFVPLFLHFYRDLKHIKKPDEENQPQHQRIVKFTHGMHWKSHPVMTYPEGFCSYFTPEIQPMRRVLSDMYIWHLGFVKDEDEVRRKAEFYEQELAKHGDRGVEAHNEKTVEFLNLTEDLKTIALYDGYVPEELRKLEIPDAEFYADKEFDNWKDIEPYSLEEVPQVWVLTKTGQWNNQSYQVAQKWNYHESAKL